MKLYRCLIVSLALLLAVNPANAWWNGGHMTVAYIAYRHLTTTTRARVDALLQLNPLYSQWIQGVSPSQTGLVAFINAATWPDCIKSSKCSPGYTSDGGDTPPGDSTDAQNIGYSDKLMHKYWHFVDEPYSAGAPGMPPKTPSALTEIKLLTSAIGSDQSDDIKSYDVVWLEHLVGDVHQPLHATSRFTINHPGGDAGGNDVAFCASPCRDELHAYWDALLGDAPTVTEVTKLGKTLMKSGEPSGDKDLDPTDWVNDSLGLVKTAVYVAPISNDNDPSNLVSTRPDAAYQQHATDVAHSQALLAGYRLAGLLNANLK